MEAVRLSLLILFHPIEGFNRIKADRERFNYLPIVVLMFLIVAVRAAYIYTTHYPLAKIEPRDSNIWLEIIRMLVPLITWVVGCYAVTAITEGKTLIRETLAAAAYSMLPYILFTLPIALLSHLMGATELKLFTNLQNIIWIWVIFLFFISTQTMNEYSFWQAVGVCFLGIVAIFLIWAIIGLFFTLTSQFYHFIEDIILEIRMLTSA